MDGKLWAVMFLLFVTFALLVGCVIKDITERKRR